MTATSGVPTTFVDPKTWTAGDAPGLIFDCDGTLAHTMPVHFVAWTAMLADHGLTFPEQQFYAMAGMPSRTIIHQLAIEQGVDPGALDIPAMTIDKENRYIDVIESVGPVAAVLAIAERYRGVLPIAVASGGDRWVVERTLHAIDAFDWFDAIVCAEDTERHKP